MINYLRNYEIVDGEILEYRFSDDLPHLLKEHGHKKDDRSIKITKLMNEAKKSYKLNQEEIIKCESCDFKAPRKELYHDVICESCYDKFDNLTHYLNVKRRNKRMGK